MPNEIPIAPKKIETQNTKTPKLPQKKSPILIVLLICGVIANMILLFIVIPIVFQRVDRLVNEQITKNITPTPSAVSAKKTKTKQSSTSENVQPCTQVSVSSPEPLNITTGEPGLKTNTTESYYDIYGSIYGDLATQLNLCGPKYEGQSYAGMTVNNIIWKYMLNFDASGRCKVIDPAVGVNVRIYYPNWNPSSDASTQLIERWNTMLTNLKIHEDGHRQIDYDGAGEILQNISIISGTDCTDVENQVQSTTSAIMDSTSQKSKDYDSTTNHGATQGANF
jgi:predicted secreted Zn-dependent protease